MSVSTWVSGAICHISSSGCQALKGEYLPLSGFSMSYASFLPLSLRQPCFFLHTWLSQHSVGALSPGIGLSLEVNFFF